MTNLDQVATLATFGAVWAVLAVGHTSARAAGGAQAVSGPGSSPGTDCLFPGSP